ncbi:MAG: histidinol dehydrogenase [Chloroflexi bacterium]|nr:histidinol dehydrogenase [Chloroflexota bacterium]
MKVVKGLEEAKRYLCEGRGLGLDNVPPHVLAGIEEVFGEPLTPTQVVERILNQVRKQGDDALRELTRILDRTEMAEIEVPPSAIADAYENVPDELVEALTLSAGRIRDFHEASRRRSWMDFKQGYGELINPVERVGAYIPGGTALYPSTVLMTAIPAKVAGVGEVIVCTPSREGKTPHPVVLVAADIAGVDRVFRIGGAQAIGAMAYGTETIPRVDIICGPGNIFVTLAKKLVYGDVGIDGLYGPTETVIVADETANPTLCAVDLLAQAEHDALARPVLITTSERLSAAVEKETQSRLDRLERGSIAKAAMDNQGCIAIVDDLEQALELANQFAPEHLCLMVREPWSHVGKVRNAGAVFLGEFSHEVLGDYVAGPSHVMPTAGTARFNSGVGVHSFVKVSPIIALDDDTSRELAKTASIIARAEGLTAHAEAAEVREELL